jgi:surface antigen
MRGDILAAFLVASALGTASAPALAGPRSPRPEVEVQVVACTPAVDCAGRLMLAGGPPPWAPAHGYRRKPWHKHKHEYHHHHHHHYDYDEHQHHEHATTFPEVGIEFGRCNRELIGGILGGVTGGVVGSQVGKRSNRTAVTIGGTIVGVLIGGAIGRSMDQADHACVAHTLEQAPPRHAVTWSDPHGRRYEVVPLDSYASAQGRVCREYRTTATIGGRNQQIYGTACRDADGNWQRDS